MAYASTRASEDAARRRLAATSRGAAVAIALLCAALAAAGCGLGAGEGAGEVSLTVTRDYGREAVAPPVSVEIVESDTAMRVLDREAEISTRYGGGFVDAIAGLASERSGGRSRDWFFFVDGVESPVGAAEFGLRGGEAIWWDYRDWGATSRVPAVVGSWPRPLVGGYEGERRPVEVACLGAGAATCDLVRESLRAAGVAPSGAPGEGAIRILVGPWAQVRRDPAAAQIEAGPAGSGVFARFARDGDGHLLTGLDERGGEARSFGPAAGLVAATRRGEAPPVWVVTGATAAGAGAAAQLLDAPTLRDRYAVAVEDGEAVALPLAGEP